MRSIRYLLVGTVIASSGALIAPDVAARGSSQPALEQIGHRLERIRLLVTKALAVKTDPFCRPLVISSDACGPLVLTTSSACKIVADSACLSSCHPSSFTEEAFTDCAAMCNANPTQACQLDCNPGCKSECLASDCDYDAVLACEASCNGECGAICASKAAGTQATEASCEIACDTTCSNHCAAASSVSGVQNCGVQCSASCGAQCTAEVNMDCQIGCQTAHFEAQTEVCVDACNAEGSLFCDGVHIDAEDIQECIDDLVEVGILVSGG